MPETFSHYTIVGRLGAGGMGEVFRATDPRLGRDVALKVLLDAFAGDPERLARFEREAKVLASLTHPNIAAIHGLEEDHGRQALVLEYVPGDDLSVTIGRGALPMEDVLDVARQIAGALDAAHEQGIIHRDLKPANVKVMRDGTVKVLDFGLAKALDTDVSGDASDPSITQSPTLMGTAHGVILGTAAYMSPEQARGKPVDKRADIWAFGCVLFEMLTGRMTFSGETISDTLAAVMRDDPRWDLLPAETPGALKAILQRCLEKDPRRRLRDIGEARIALEAIQNGATTSTIHIGEPEPSGVQSQVTPAAPQKPKPGLVRRLVRGVFRTVHWAFTIMFFIAWVTFMVLFIVSENEEPEPQPVVRALITPAEGKTFDTAFFGTAAFHALSPDGRQIVFASDDRLWVRSLDEINATPIDGTIGASFAFWSGDGRSIGFFADGKLKTVPAAGGPVTVVCDAPDARGGTWNRNNVIVFTPRLRTGLYRVPASGGTPEPITEVKRPTHSTHRWPRFLPDGDHILYLAANHTNPKGAQTAIYMTSLSAGDSQLLVPSDAHPVYAAGYLLYARDRNLMARPFNYRTGRYGEPIRVAENCMHTGGSWVGVYDARSEVLTYQGNAPPIGSVMTWTDESGKKLGAIDTRALHWDAEISRDGKQIAIARGNPEPSIYIYDVERQAEMRLTTDGFFSRAPVWSPDGTRIAYATIRDNGRLNVYVARVDQSSTPEPLLVEDVDMIPSSWSPDGKSLIVDHGDPGETEIWVIDMENNPVASPLVPTRGWVSDGVLSPNGKWLAYVSREEGTDEIMVIPFPGPGPKVKVSTRASDSPRWAGDNGLFFVSTDYVVRTRFSVSGGAATFSLPEDLFRIRSDQSFFVQSDSRLNISPDGRLLCKLADQDPSDITAITLVVGWTSELKKQ